MAVTLKGSGQVPVQVVQTVKTDTFTMSSTTYTNVTGMSATITPSSSSNRVLIFSQIAFAGQSGAAAVQIRFQRNGTTIFVGDTSGNRTPITFESITSDNQVANIGTYVYLDSPATTSSVTYQLQMRSSDGPLVALNRSASNADQASRGSGASSIVLMEISG